MSQQETASGGAQRQHKTTLVKAWLKDIKKGQSDIRSICVASRNGLALASLMRRGDDPERLAALCASTMEVSKRNTTIFQIGEFEYTIVKGSTGCIIVMIVNEAYLIGLHMGKRGNLALLLEAMEQGAVGLASILSL